MYLYRQQLFILKSRFFTFSTSLTSSFSFSSSSSSSSSSSPLYQGKKRDVIIIGGGHNGLVAAAYLSKAGLDVLVLEKRHCIGGAAVTEELYPGFKFSRASYLAGLLRPQIIQDLNLEKYGFQYISRDPSSFTPTLMNSKYHGKHLILGSNPMLNHQSISQFSLHDAEAYPKYEEFLNQIREIVQPILDSSPPDITSGNIPDKIHTLSNISKMIQIGYQNRSVLIPFYELMVGPATTILNRWFESDILKTTLATDSVIGAMNSPSQMGSAYVLLHHVMGEADGKKGVWAYIKGGMGSISEAIATSARINGTEIQTNAIVKKIAIHPTDRTAQGVEMNDGTFLSSKAVISGINPQHTFIDLMTQHAEYMNTDILPKDFIKHIRNIDYSCGAFKINLAIDKLPDFTCYPSSGDGRPGPMHSGTVHFESSMHEIEDAYKDAMNNRPATRPVIEMTIPSALDPSLAPPGQHIAQLFIQYAPYDIDPALGAWSDEKFKMEFAHRCLRIVEEFCPGFMKSILYMDVLSPLDLEKIFGLYKGNIFHGSLSLHQLGYMRPAPGYSTYRTPIKNLYMCSAGTHPGGGVMGAGGRNCALVVQRDLVG